MVRQNAGYDLKREKSRKKKTTSLNRVKFSIFAKLLVVRVEMSVVGNLGIVGTLLPKEKLEYS